VIAAPAMLMTDVCGWDVGTWSRAVRFWESRAPIRGRALELGARRGGLSLWLAAHGCDVLCSDLWGSQCRARPLHDRYGVVVAYEDIDATAIPYTASFDLVVFKSMLGALRSPEQQARAIAEMHARCALAARCSLPKT
jgi:2-polyprenyl-3-methyl-5-hydroxy-6-metoxy-1,4-benzoquinol methylase